MGPGRRKVHAVRALGLGGVAQEDAKGDAAPLMANRLTTGNLSVGKARLDSGGTLERLHLIVAPVARS